jgi:hypothetical protein
MDRPAVIRSASSAALVLAVTIAALLGLPALVAAQAAERVAPVTGTGVATSSTSATRVASLARAIVPVLPAAPKPVREAAGKATSSTVRGASESAQLQSLLASLKSRYKYLGGVTVTIGRTPGGYQAVSYYTAGRIVVSPKHRASLSRIMNHEIWHIIDWRDNGRIDWRESVPPRNASSYLK